MRSTFGHRRRAAIGTLLIGLLGAMLAGPLPAGAVAPTGAPVLTAPDADAVVADGPVLSWEALVGATSYEVQVSSDSSFEATPLLSLSTANLHAAPTTELPLGGLHWRVRGKDAAGLTGPWGASSFTRSALAVPALSTPADGATLRYPSEPPVLTWSVTTGAAHYRVEVDDSDAFVSPIVQTLTATTSYTFTQPQTVGQDLFWRVQAVSAGGINSEWSPVRTYTTSWDAAPVPVRPDDDAHVTDVVLEWEPVLGAAAYELQVSPNGDWANNTSIAETVKGTRFSPAKSLNNGSYFWRVRAVDGGKPVSNKAPWSTERVFHREWLPIPTLELPADGNMQVGVPTFSWTAIDRASRYELQVGTDSNFSPTTYSTCTTNQTTFTPYVSLKPYAGGCNVDPAIGTTYHWRVRGLDDPGGILGRWSDTHSFLYRKPLPVLTGPADGAETSAPVLTWNPVADVEQYRVVILKLNGNVAEQRDTWGLSYSPLTKLRPEDGPFTWYVQTKDHNGHLGLFPAPENRRTFTVVEPAGTGEFPDPVSVTPSAGSSRMPSLRWTPVTGAAKYTVNFSSNGVYTALQTSVPYAALTDADKPSATGTYDWFVEAFTSTGARINRGAASTYKITPGNLATYTAPCEVGEICADEPGTPTLAWQSVDKAGYYLVTVALDPAFTNIHREFRTQYTTLTQRESLVDNQAGQSYYWFVRACVGTLCGPFGAAEHDTAAKFRKKTAPVTGLRTVGGDPRMPILAWNDYLTARQYRVQVSTTQDFAALIDEATVDQTTYAPWNKTYPVGPLYARVQALDGSSNLLTVSVPLRFDRAGDAPALTLPAADAVVEGVPHLQWAPEAYAASYDVEVYKNGDTTGSPVNRVLNQRTAQSAWSPTSGLPPGEYTWRVRRLDVDARVGRWSAARLFTLKPAGVQLTAPEDEAKVTRDLLFSWLAVPGAARYRWETSTTAAFTSPQKVDTAATSYAPTALPLGTQWWRVSTLDGKGVVLSTSAIRSVTTQTAGSGFVAVPPVRLLDTRQTQPVGPAATLELQVTGLGQVPDGAEAVVLNITSVYPTAPGYVTAFPAGQERPNASTLNNVVGTVRPNLAVVKLGSGGRVALYNSGGSTHLLADLAGYYSETAVEAHRYTPIPPVRRLDTRIEGARQPLGPGASLTLDVTDGTLVPLDASAVTVNVTAVSPTAEGFVTVHPSGTVRPKASNLNNAKGVTAANLVTVQTGTEATSRSITLFNNSGTSHLLVDVAGYYSESSEAAYTPMPPTRLLDTRYATGIPSKTPIRATGSVSLNVQRDGVPRTAKAVVLNLTSVGAKSPGHVTAYPSGSTRPTVSNLNVVTGDVRPNLVVVKVGSNGTVTLYNGAGEMHLVADVAGWFE